MASRCLKYSQVTTNQDKVFDFDRSLRKYKRDENLSFADFKRSIGGKKLSFDAALARRDSGPPRADKGQVLYELQLKYHKRYPNYQLGRIISENHKPRDDKYEEIATLDDNRPKTEEVEDYYKKVAKILGLNTYHNPKKPKFSAIKPKVETGLSPRTKESLFPTPQKKVIKAQPNSRERKPTQNFYDNNDDDRPRDEHSFDVSAARSLSISHTEKDRPQTPEAEEATHDNVMVTNPNSEIIAPPTNTTSNTPKVMSKRMASITKETQESGINLTPTKERKSSFATETSPAKQSEDVRIAKKLKVPRDYTTDDQMRYFYYYKRFKNPVERRDRKSVV